MLMAAKVALIGSTNNVSFPHSDFRQTYVRVANNLGRAILQKNFIKLNETLA